MLLSYFLRLLKFYICQQTSLDPSPPIATSLSLNAVLFTPMGLVPVSPSFQQIKAALTVILNREANNINLTLPNTNLSLRIPLLLTTKSSVIFFSPLVHSKVYFHKIAPSSTSPILSSLSSTFSQKFTNPTILASQATAPSLTLFPCMLVLSPILVQSLPSLTKDNTLKILHSFPTPSP